MNTAFVYDPAYLLHETGFSHPEKAFRLQSILSQLEGTKLLEKLLLIQPELCDIRLIEDTHTPEHVARIRTLCENAPSHVDIDTPVSRESFYAAHLAVSGVLSACSAVANGKVRNAFCAVRPPGHHAEKQRSMGFCLFNNVAIAANFLRSELGYRRILIVDWDVHHGNGTQDIFYENPEVFFFSIHQHYLFPGTGAAEEHGSGAGEGTTLNVPMPPGAGDEEYVRAFREQLLPAALEFSPDFVLISAGFDAHADDPLAYMRVSEYGFQQMTLLVQHIAQNLCGGRIVSVLEGGYDLDALARSVGKHIEALMRCND